MKGYYSQVVQLLKDAGFTQVRQGKGAHEISGRNGVFVVVSHHCDSRHTANAILKSAELQHKF
jgi:predicted RNA binding protein YcfA (HicA-like mRNA interferase family)